MKDALVAHHSSILHKRNDVDSCWLFLTKKNFDFTDLKMY